MLVIDYVLFLQFALNTHSSSEKKQRGDQKKTITRPFLFWDTSTTETLYKMQKWLNELFDVYMAHTSLFQATHESLHYKIHGRYFFRFFFKNVLCMKWNLLYKRYAKQFSQIFQLRFLKPWKVFRIPKKLNLLSTAKKINNGVKWKSINLYTICTPVPQKRLIIVSTKYCRD